jgi:hypothetical protein
VLLSLKLVISAKTAKALGLSISAAGACDRRRGDRMSNCDFVAGRSLIELGRVKAGVSRPRAMRGFGLDPKKINQRSGGYQAVGKECREGGIGMQHLPLNLPLSSA